jgi:hypothetical protein
MGRIKRDEILETRRIRAELTTRQTIAKFLGPRVKKVTTKIKN